MFIKVDDIVKVRIEVSVKIIVNLNYYIFRFIIF